MSYQYVNAAYEYLQDELTINGVETFVQETIVTGLTATPLTDPSTQVSLTDTGYFDGQSNSNPPQLPTNLLGPLRLWERMSNNSAANFVDMAEANDGLPQLQQTPRFQFWEWRQDGLYMPGATFSNDLRIRYNASLTMLTVDTDPVQIRHSLNAMSFLTAWNFAITSGDSMISDTLMSAAKEHISQMCVRGARRNQRGSHRRQGYGRARGGYGY